MQETGGEVSDDTSIDDDCRMLRRIHPAWINEFRPERSNFEIRRPHVGLSVTAWLSDADLEAVLAEAPTFGVVRVTAGELRAAGFKIMRVPEPDNPNHCECYGAISKGDRKKLALASVWVRPPSEHDPASYGVLDAF
ncbi:hypothetical protein [Novosphingobium jiangmenense]|uniref:Uncharacterized protein n=1 Tax=Novosphingobium jiangmenense TaxID=2791981 RepID=A0ABS0HF63_9SPHN|nr:hypothetical protein [Novosphingobium jiangmenense]MBF9150878.1 hypothetical protein [Novosphingobium jiangmenense]